MTVPIEAIMSAGAELGKSSWEFGAASEALLQLHNPELSVFGSDPFQKAKEAPSGTSCVGLTYAKRFIETDGDILIDGDGSSGDTAALGVYCAMLGLHDAAYRAAADREVRYLLHQTPRWENGAISHRSEYPELWADFIFMVPPFLAYQAIVTEDEQLLDLAIKQCTLYAEVLSTGTVWKHIIGPVDRPQRDTRLWATGNGWVAAGLVRVLATGLHAFPNRGSQNLSAGIEKLIELTSNLIEGAVTSATNGTPPMLCNYLDDSEYFGDVAGTALIAASAFRLAQLAPEKYSKRHLDWAEEAWKNIEKVVANRNGDVGPTPMPGVATSRIPCQKGSSQGHSFVVMCFAARRDWLQKQEGKMHDSSPFAYWRDQAKRGLKAWFEWLWR